MAESKITWVPHLSRSFIAAKVGRLQNQNGGLYFAANN
jgi:hypothetical protein